MVDDHIVVAQVGEFEDARNVLGRARLEERKPLLGRRDDSAQERDGKDIKTRVSSNTPLSDEVLKWSNQFFLAGQLTSALRPITSRAVAAKTDATLGAMV